MSHKCENINSNSSDDEEDSEIGIKDASCNTSVMIRDIEERDPNKNEQQYYCDYINPWVDSTRWEKSMWNIHSSMWQTYDMYYSFFFFSFCLPLKHWVENEDIERMGINSQMLSWSLDMCRGCLRTITTSCKLLL